MKLGYDLTIEQAQKLVMTPELIQAIQILQFNTQELDAYVGRTASVKSGTGAQRCRSFYRRLRGDHESRFVMLKSGKRLWIPTRRFRMERIHQRQAVRRHQLQAGEYTPDEEKNDPLERYVSSDVTLPEHLLFQLQCAELSSEGKRIGEYIIESLDENGYLTSSAKEMAEAVGVSEES